MQVALRTVHANFKSRDAARSVGQSRPAFGKHAGVGNDDVIGAEPAGVLGDKLDQRSAANFFFAFDEKPDIDRKRLRSGEQRFDGFDVGEKLAFVVRRTASKNFTGTHDCRKWWRAPEVKRFGRLHIVMPVHEHSRPAGNGRLRRFNNRMASSRMDGNSEAELPEMFSEPAGTCPEIGVVLGLGRDAGKADELLEFGEKPGAMLVEITFDYHAGIIAEARSPGEQRLAMEKSFIAIFEHFSSIFSVQ